MNLKPYEEFSIISKLSPAEIKRNLARVTMLYNPIMRRFEYFEGQNYLFEGSIGISDFKLKVIRGNPRGIPTGGKSEVNIPIIKGIITTVENGCLVNVRIAPSYLIFIPLLIVTAFEGLFIAIIMAGGNWPFILLAIFTPLISYLAVKFTIGSKSVEIESALRKIFE